jgi:TonB family protein
VRLIRDAATSDTLWVEFSSAAGSSETVRFPVGGLASRLHGLTGQCGDLLAPDVVWSESDVDRQVSAAPGNAPPRYPATLRGREVEGKVVVEFVVDTAGRIEPTSVRVQSATDPAFAAAVTSALPSYRYVPARVAGHRVRQRAVQPFDFSSR